MGDKLGILEKLKRAWFGASEEYSEPEEKLEPEEYVERARKDFADLRGEGKYSFNPSPSNIESRVFSICYSLRKAGVGFAALDETGKSSDEEMERRLRETVNGLNLASARELFVTLERQDYHPSPYILEYDVQYIHDHLRQAGVGLAALDETGGSSDEEMEGRLQEAIRRHQGIRHHLDRDDENSPAP